MSCRASICVLESVFDSRIIYACSRVDDTQVFLLFQTTDTTTWSHALVDSRSAYSSLREHLLRYMENSDELDSALNPLDDDRHVRSPLLSRNVALIAAY